MSKPVTLTDTLAIIAKDDGVSTTKAILAKYHLVGASGGQRSRVSKATKSLIRKGFIVSLGRDRTRTMIFKVTPEGLEALQNGTVISPTHARKPDTEKKVAPKLEKKKVAKKEPVAAKSKTNVNVKAKAKAKVKKAPVPVAPKAKPLIDKKLYAALKAKGIDDSAIQAMEKAQLTLKNAKAEIAEPATKKPAKAMVVTTVAKSNKKSVNNICRLRKY
jgi:DNA-binding MarR family transcriptional regulator